MARGAVMGILSLLFLSCGRAGDRSSLANFGHLIHLTERIPFHGDSVDVVHVYANYPDYEWVGAAESGQEGIACVDDAARAAVLYLRHFELTGDRASLTRALPLLKFVRAMETEDGNFYNFILKDHSVNTSGKTSYKSFGWWAARGVWALGTAARVLDTLDPRLADQMKDGVLRALPHLDSLEMRYGNVTAVQDYRIPGWLLYGSGADVTSEMLLGLTSYYASSRSDTVKKIITELAEGLMAMQDGSMSAFPYGLHRSWRTLWHMWGNGQTEALAVAGKLLNDHQMIRSAAREADCFYSRLLIEGFMKEMDVVEPSKKKEFEQIAYAVRPMTVGLLRLYDATGKKDYLRMAGLSASWLLGNNVAGQVMYDTATGRCFDGIRDSTSVNKNSGAESTIEALMTLVELEHYPDALRYLRYRKIGFAHTMRYLYAVYSTGKEPQLVLALDLKTSGVLILENKACRAFLGKLTGRKQ